MEEQDVGHEGRGHSQESFTISQLKGMSVVNDDTLTSVDIQEMEKVRLSLKSMLKSSERLIEDKMSPTHELHQGISERFLQSAVDDQSSFTSIGTADLLENFVNSNKATSVAVLADTITGSSGQHTSNRFKQKYDHNSLLIENALLNEKLEKECLKRKHCEEQIKELQAKLLETMQELAVSVSGDRKKDAMINQLDKKMAKVVEDWKKHEQQKMEALNKLEERRNQDEQSQQNHREMLAQFEKDLTQAVEALSNEQERAANTEEAKNAQIKEITEDRDQLLTLLENESQNVSALRAKLQELEDRNKREGTSVSMLQEEKKNWLSERNELESKIEMITAAHNADLENERKLLDNERQVAEDSQKVLYAVQKEVQLLNVQLDTANREKENLRTEITLLTAKFEAQKTRLDGERQAELEKQLERRLHETQNQVRKNEEELRKAHKTQIDELSKRYKSDLDSQLRDFHEQLKERDLKERSIMQTYDDYEKKLSKCREKIASVTAERETLKNKSNKLIHQLRKMMRYHCEEALSLLASGVDKEIFSGSEDQSNDLLWSPEQNPDHVVVASSIVPAAENHNMSSRHQNSTLQKIPTAKKDNVGSGQHWVALTPVTNAQMRQSSPININQSTVHSNVHKNTNVEESHRSLNVDHVDGKNNIVENSPSEASESFEEQPLENQQEVVSWSTTNLGSNVFEMLHDQNSRQNELNHYVRQLLKKSPSNAGSEDTQHKPSTTQTGNGELLVEPEMKTDKEFVADTRSLSSSMEYSKHRAFKKSIATPTKISQSSKIPVYNTPPNKDVERTDIQALTPNQVGQLARLIEIYQSDKNDEEVLTHQKMFQYLREVQSRSAGREEMKRNVSGGTSARHGNKVKRQLEVNIPTHKPKDVPLLNASRSVSECAGPREVQSHDKHARVVAITSDSDISLPRRSDNRASKGKQSKVSKRFSSGKAWK